MEPQHEFGKEAFERQRRAERNKKRTGFVLKMIGLLILVSTAVYFAGDIKKVIASNSSSKGKKEKKTKHKLTGEMLPQVSSPDVTVIRKWDLPESLTEISGLSYLDNDRFACVQDELGTIFIYNTAKSTIEKEISFGPAGDYEGLAIVGANVWVLRSDGKLFEVNNINTEKPEVREYATRLTAEQDTEGLCYDKENNRLLLAVKDDGNEASLHYKGIYAFDLTTKKMPADPVFKIDLNDEAFAAVKGKKDRTGSIMPSGIAIHPITNDLYITEGRKAKILITDGEGAIKKLYQLDNQYFEQPEGITFKPNGEIYISNEGVKQGGNIMNVIVGSSGSEKL